MDSLLFSRYNSSNSFRLGGGNVNAYRLRLAAVSMLSLILLWFFLPVFSGILNIGNITGILLFGGLLLYVLNLHRIRLHMKKNQRTPLRFLLIVVKVFLLLAFITALVESFFMAKACISKPEPESTVVVLGCQNGSRMMLSRVNAATEYLSKHPDTICILSGGAGSDEAVPEAEYMYDWMIKKGANPASLLTETQSTSTRENLQYSLEIANEHGLNTDFAVVTNEFHEYRASLGAKKLGIRTGSVAADTPWWLFPTFYVRELYGILYEVFL